MGVVYYANYLVWFEVARTDLLREAGWSYREMEAEGYVLLATGYTVHASIDRGGRPCRLPDRVRQLLT